MCHETGVDFIAMEKYGQTAISHGSETYRKK
jgi:hypothetical protein